MNDHQLENQRVVTEAQEDTDPDGVPGAHDISVPEPLKWGEWFEAIFRICT